MTQLGADCQLLYSMGPVYMHGLPQPCLPWRNKAAFSGCGKRRNSYLMTAARPFRGIYRGSMTFLGDRLRCDMTGPQQRH